MLPAIIQQNRSIRVHTALKYNELLFRSMSGSEQLSGLFDYQLSLVSKDHDIKPVDLLGTGITVELELHNGQNRHFHGLVSSWLQVAGSDDLACYEVTLKPWLWFLSRTSDCRIFQEMTVPDIIMQIFRDEGFTDVENALTENYTSWDYCVQYRETDYSFISRLMEQEGIYYYFKHEMGLHKLVLCDGISAHDFMPGYEKVRYYPPGNDKRRERDSLNRWDIISKVEPGRFSYKDYNFKSPRSDLLVRSDAAAEHALSNYEIYEYPGEYIERSQGEAAIRKRREQSQAQHEVAHGSGNVQGLSAGNLFQLGNLRQSNLNQEYLITQSDMSMKLDNYSSGGSSEVDFHCDITAISSRVVFRAPRITPKPLVQGPQTAFVVGPAGNEIWTDEYGRVKLQFHWDRYGTADENSSCWVRVSQLWAGQGWGAMHIPRIGQEVIVEFLEGDPDRPIITGRVYNGDNGVPYGLPEHATQSGIKSRSSKGGSAANYNEIRMEDKKGEEELYFHAEKNQTTVVENDQAVSVGHDRSVIIGNDETITIQNDRVETVKHDETITINNDRKSEIFGNAESWVYKNEEHYVQQQQYTYVKGTFLGEYESTFENRVQNDITVTSTAGKVLIDANTSIELRVGASSLKLQADGTITLKGKDIRIKGSSSITETGKTITSEAKGKNTMRGASIESTATGINEIKGSVVKANA